MSSTRPGVEITQVITETAAPTVIPTLVPCVVGVCRQIVEAFDSEGALNADALYAGSSYSQAAMLIPQASFPDPRSNIDEINIEEDYIRAFLRYGGRTRELPRGSHGTFGQAFLKACNTATRAAFRTDNVSSWTPGVGETTFVVAFDVINSATTSSDVTVSFTAGETYTPTTIAEAINAAVGADVATVVDTNYVLIASTVFGAKSSVTIRAGSGVVDYWFDGGLDDTVEHRVEGAGFRGQDDGDGDLTTPWVEFFQGEYYEDGGSTGFPSYAGMVNIDGDFSSAVASAITFAGTSATVPLQAATATRPGDQFWTDGVQYGGTEVIKAETTRFKLGKLNSTLSTFDDEGRPSNRVYDTVEVTILSSTALAPKYVYFRADGLVYGQITPEGTAAALTGDNQYAIAARYAYLQSTEDISGPFNMAGLTLDYTLVEDGVETSSTYTFASGSYASVALLAASINIEGVVAAASPSGNRLVLRTAKTGANQGLSLAASGTANDVLALTDAAGTPATGKDVEYCTAATITGSAVALPIVSAPGDTFSLTLEDSTGVHVIGPVAIALGGLTTAGEVVGAIADALNGTAVGSVVSSVIYDGGIPIATISCPDAAETASTVLTVTSVEGGATVTFLFSNGTGDFLTDAGFAADPGDTGEDGINGKTLEFTLDAVPTTYTVTFTSNSLVEAIDDINNEVGSAVDVASASVDNEIVLTSQLVGVASSVTVTASDAGSFLGLSGMGDGEATGTGRPNPDFYVDADGSASIGGVVLRNTATGTPYSVASSSASLYLQYRGIRLDVTSSAASPSLLSFDNVDDMLAAIGPLSTANPLAVGCFLAMQNATTVSVAALGIDEANDAAPYGTLDGWSRALDYLEQKEVYGVAPLTDDTYVQGLVASHVQAMSEPENRGERIAFVAPPFSTRAPSTTIMSGQSGASTGSSNEFLLDDSPLDELVSAGITGPAISYDEQLYLQVLITDGGATELRRYSVSNVNNTLLTLRTTFTAAQNTDGFFSTTPLIEELTGADYTLFVRGAELVITGTARPDLSAIAAAEADVGEAYASRRVYCLFGSSLDISIDGVTQNVPMFYASAAIVGMIAQLNPQQPFTNVPVTGLGRVYGSDDTFSENQMDVIADGGRYVLVNFGGRVMSRHSRSTATTSVEVRELSITKAIDWLTKVLRSTNRIFIGRYVITPGFIDQLTLANEGVLRTAISRGVVTAAALTDIAQSETEPDTVLLEVTVQPAYPCNKIKITIVT